MLYDIADVRETNDLLRNKILDLLKEIDINEQDIDNIRRIGVTVGRKPVPISWFHKV